MTEGLLFARYSKALERIGHANLLQIPKEIGLALELADDLSAKTKLLETIADVLDEKGLTGLEEVAAILREENERYGKNS